MRPHVKIHKSVDVGARQIAQGAIGLTCATMAEAELMSGAGIKHVLWTKQPASINNISRAVALSKKDPTFMFVVDDPQVVDGWKRPPARRTHDSRIAVSVFAGMTRQGIANGKPAVRTGAEGGQFQANGFEGFMAYSGNAAHTKTWRRDRRDDRGLAFVRPLLWRAKPACR